MASRPPAEAGKGQRSPQKKAPPRLSDGDTQSPGVAAHLLPLVASVDDLTAQLVAFDQDAGAAVGGDVAIIKELRQVCTAVMLDAAYHTVVGLEDRMWRCCFYRRIMAWRAAIADARGKGDGVALEATVGQFLEFLEASVAVYTQLLVHFKAQLEPTAHWRGHQKQLLWTCHRCHIFAGDLERYKQQYCTPAGNDKEWSRTEAHYRLAHKLLPASGNPHNQLAVIASVQQDLFGAIYRYCRCLMSESPMAVARDNLSTLFEKVRLQVAQRLADPGTVALAALKPADVARDPEAPAAQLLLEWTLLRLCRCAGMVFTAADLETMPKVLNSLVRDLCKLIKFGQLNCVTLLEAVVICLFGTQRKPDGGDDSRAVHVLAYGDVLFFDVATQVAKCLAAFVYRGSRAGGQNPKATAAARLRRRGEEGGGDGAAGDASASDGDSSEDGDGSPGVWTAKDMDRLSQLLMPVAVVCDWLVEHVDRLDESPDAAAWEAGAKTRKASRRGKRDKHKGRGKRKARGAAASDGAYDDTPVDVLRRRAQHRLLLHLVTAYNRMQASESLKAALEASTPGDAPADPVTPVATEDGMAGAVAAAVLEDAGKADAGVCLGLPEEVELRGFAPLGGLYDHVMAPDAPEEATPTDSELGAPLDASVLQRRMDKVKAALGAIAARPTTVLGADDTSGVFAVGDTVVAGAGGDPAAGGVAPPVFFRSDVATGSLFGGAFGQSAPSTGIALAQAGSGMAASPAADPVTELLPDVPASRRPDGTVEYQVWSPAPPSSSSLKASAPSFWPPGFTAHGPRGGLAPGQMSAPPLPTSPPPPPQSANPFAAAARGRGPPPRDNKWWS